MMCFEDHLSHCGYRIMKNDRGSAIPEIRPISLPNRKPGTNLVHVLSINHKAPSTQGLPHVLNDCELRGKGGGLSIDSFEPTSGDTVYLFHRRRSYSPFWEESCPLQVTALSLTSP